MFSLEGNIGVGKSTVLRELERQGVRVHLEAVDHWTLLEQFYSDPARFGFAFQLQVLVSYVNTPEDTQVVERSIDAALRVFVPLAQESGNMTPNDTEDLFRVAQRLPVPPIQKFVFLRAPVDMCLRRILWRDRDGESHITREYLEQLESKYEDFINSLPEDRKIVIDVQEGDSPAAIAQRIRGEFLQH
jgi:deoxyadenosine/deoxycytidine kinase